jgi:hypothetical protein
VNQNENFYYKNHEDNFEEDIIWMTDSESFIFEIMFNQKSITALLKLNSHQIFFDLILLLTI